MMAKSDQLPKKDSLAQHQENLVEICVDTCTNLSAIMKNIQPLSAARESVANFVALAGNFKVQNSVFEPLKGIFLTVCGSGPIPPHSELPDFFCDQPCSIFMLFLRGRCTINVMGDEGIHFELEENSFIAGDWYGQHTKGNITAPIAWSHVSLMITEDAARKHFGVRFAENMARILHFRKDGTRRNIPILTGCSTPDLVSIGRRLVSMRKDDPLSVMELRSAALDFFSRILRNATLHSMYKSSILTEHDVHILTILKNCIENEFLKKISIKELCLSIGMSESKANRGFKKLFNFTISAFLHNCKLQYAHTMLSERKRNVSECAFEIGYTCISHFITAYRKRYGQTPGTTYRISPNTYPDK